MIPVFDDDESIVDGIIHRKCNDPELRANEVRKHPEEPSVLQYLVLVEDHEKAEKEKIMDKFKISEGDGSVGDNDDDDDDTPKKKKEGERKERGLKGQEEIQWKVEACRSTRRQNAHVQIYPHI